jgi:co-chaperonin GroES (HSP10)
MLRDNVLVQEMSSKETETAGGIILTAPLDNKGAIPAFVVAVGPEVTLVKPKDKVFLDWSKGTAVEVADNVQGVSIQEKYIKAVVEEE